MGKHVCILAGHRSLNTLWHCHRLFLSQCLRKCREPSSAESLMSAHTWRNVDYSQRLYFFYKEMGLIFISPVQVQVPYMLFFTVKNQGLLGIQIGRKSQPLRKNAFY